MKIRNKRILALLSTTALVVVAGTVSSKADETTDKQAYLNGTRRELVGGFQLPPDTVGVVREATLASGTGALAVFDVVTTITDAANTVDMVAGPYQAPFVNNSVDEVPYLDGISDVRNIVTHMEGGSVGQLWGAYYYTDVPNGTITHNVTGGVVGALVGGANLTDSTNMRPGYTPGQIQGVEINVSGGQVGQIRGGNSASEGGLAASQNIGSGGITINITGGVVGQEGQQDAIRGAGGSFNGVEGKVSINISGESKVLGDVYAGGRQSMVESTEINISGGTITGNVYGGGSYAESSAVVSGDTRIHISGGTINGDVFGGGMNDRVEGNTFIVMSGASSVVNGTLHGGSNAGLAAARSVSGLKSIDFGTADSAYTGTVSLADFNQVNVNNGSTTIESLTPAANGTSVAVELHGTLNVKNGTLHDLENLSVLGGTLNVDMDGSNAPAITGKSLTLAGGSVVHVTNAEDSASGIYVFGFDAVDDMGDITLTLNGETVSASMWDMSNGVLVIRELTAANLSLSGNQKLFYNALQAMNAAGDASPEIRALVASRNEAEVKARLDALSGHEYATSMSSQIDGNMGHLRRLRASMGKGASLGAAAPAAPVCTAKGAEIGAPYAPADMRRWRVGAQGFVDAVDIDSDRRGDGYKRTEAGALLAAEYDACDALTLGGAVSYGRTSLRTAHARSRHEDNTRMDLYGLYSLKRWSFASSLGVGLHTHHMKRYGTRSSHVDGCSVNFQQEVAYDVMRRQDSNVQVYAGAESSWNKMESLREYNGGYTLRMRSQDAWATDVSVGLRCNVAFTPLGGAPAGVFTVQTGAVGSVGAVNPAARMSLDGYGYRQECATRDRWGWEIGAGVELPVSSTLSFFGTVESIIRSDSHSVDGQVGMRMAF